MGCTAHPVLLTMPPTTSAFSMLALASRFNGNRRVVSTRPKDKDKGSVVPAVQDPQRDQRLDRTNEDNKSETLSAPAEAKPSTGEQLASHSTRGTPTNRTN